jgi:transposase
VLQTVPGMGQILRLVLWSEMHDSARFPRVQAFGSSGRVVTCAKASAGTRSGTAGTKIGQASLTGAFSEAAVLVLRHPPAGQKYLARIEQQHGQGQALPGLAHQRARAVYDRLTRGTAFDLDQCRHGSRRGAGEPAAERGHHGLSRTTVLGKETPPASANAPEPRGAWP